MANCAMPDLGAFQSQAPRERHVGGSGVVTLVPSTPFFLRWTPPPNEGAVTGYRVYFRSFLGRTMEDGRWVLLREAPAGADPGIVVNAGEMPDGVYEMGVSAVGPGGESALHRSSDPTASPSTGWSLRLHAEK